MIINLQPEENIRVKVMAKQPGLDRDGVKLKEVTLDVSLSHSFAGERRRIAYERLLLDFIEGEQTLFVRRDEVEAQWQWIDSILGAWDEIDLRSEEHTSELQSLMRISYAVFCLQKKKHTNQLSNH